MKPQPKVSCLPVSCLSPDEDMLKRARDIANSCEPEAVGYRLIVKPLTIDTGMKAGEAEVAPHLASLNFEITSSNQAKRETKGSDVGILISVGPGAFKAMTDNPQEHGWAKVGDVVVFHRYAGKEVEIPPGSGNMVRFINDEDLFGKYPVNVLEGS